MAGFQQIRRPVWLLLTFPRVGLYCPLAEIHQGKLRKVHSILYGEARFHNYVRCFNRTATSVYHVCARTLSKRAKKKIANEEDVSLGVPVDDVKPKRRSKRTEQALETDVEVSIAREPLKTSSGRKKSSTSSKKKKSLDAKLESLDASETLKRKSSKTAMATEAEETSENKAPKRKRASKKPLQIVEDEAQVVTIDDEKPKKRRQKKKEASEEDEATLEPSFPFDGATKAQGAPTEYCAANDEFGTTSNLSNIRRMDTSHGRFYLITTTNGEVCFPSVTTVLKETMPRDSFFRLHAWRKNMIKEHGVEGFETISREVRQLGTNFHQDLEARLLKDSTQDVRVANQTSLDRSTETSSFEEGRGGGSTVSSLDDEHTYNRRSSTKNQKTANGSWKILPSNINESSGYMLSVEHVLNDISDVQVLEGTVAHYELGYTGTFDCVAKYRGELCLIDWKTSGKPRPSLSDCYEYPLQAAAYAGAINDDPRYSFKVYNALIVVVYPNGEPAHAHFLSYNDCLTYWTKWLKRLQEYQTQSSGDLSNVYVEI